MPNGQDIGQRVAGGLRGTGINQGQASPLGQSIVEGAFKMGFSLLGGGLAKQFDNPQLAQAAAETGENITQTLRNEWHSKQAENFRNIHGKRYMGEMQRLQADYKRKTELHSMDTIDPETGQPMRVQGFIPVDSEGVPKPEDLIRSDSTEAFQHLQKAAEEFYGETGRLSMEFLDAAGQYPDNPMISGLAQNVMNFFSQQAGHAATGRKEAQEQLTFMNQQEAGRIARGSAQEQYMQQVAQREQREASMQAAQQEARAEAAVNENFRAVLDRAGLPSDPKKWKNDQGIQAAALLERMRQEETRKSQLLRQTPFRPIVPPDTPLENAADVVKTTKLYEDSAETMAGNLASLQQQALMSDPEFQKELTAQLTPQDKQKLLQTRIEQWLSTPEARTEVQRLALRDSMTKTYALDSGFRAKVDSEVAQKINSGDWKRYEGEPNIDVYMEHTYPNSLPINPANGKPFANRGAYLEWRQKQEAERRKAVEAAAQETIDTEKEERKKGRFRFTAAGEAAGVEKYRQITRQIMALEQAMSSAAGPEMRKLERLVRQLRNLRDQYPSPAGSLLRRGVELFRESQAERAAQREETVAGAEALLRE